MDDYLFKANVDRCKSVVEHTSYLEMQSYSESHYNSVEQHTLTSDEFENFLYQRGAFSPPKIPEGIDRVATLRIMRVDISNAKQQANNDSLQQYAEHPETFAPMVISLEPHEYTSMVKVLHLPYRAIEGTTVVGAFFWCAWDQDDENPHLQIIFRKSDVRKKGFTRGWELMLSHDVHNGVTTGFAKGTPSSDMVECIRHLKACIGQIGHPMLLPMIIFSHDFSHTTDIKQRDARDWLRRLEHAVSMRSEIIEKEGYVKEGVVDLDAVNRDLVECHSQVLWKRPQAYLKILSSMEDAMKNFKTQLPQHRSSPALGKLHRSLLSRMEFYRVKLHCIDSYAFTTLQRLDIQRSALYNIIAQKESKLNFQMAGEQRKLAHASKRDSAAMKTISLLGAIFLPGAYLASVFSTSFFNFQASGDSTISGQFWIYWATTIPITMLIVGVWVVWEKKREARYNQEDLDLEKGAEDMEKSIMATMRKRTMSKTSTWGQEGAIRKEKLNS